MKTDPLISVIIPTYNRYPMVKEAIESVLDQSFQDFELILADDGSTDETESLAKKYPIRFLKLAHCGMPGKVRNLAAKLAKGHFLAFLDSDDIWLPDKLKLQLAFFEKNPREVICHTKEIWDRQGKIISQRKQKHKRQGMIFPDALKKCIIGPSTAMMTKEIFFKARGFPEKLQIAEDYGLWLRTTSQWPVGYLDIPLIRKRDGHPAQLSHSHDQIEIFRLQALGSLLHSWKLSPENQKLAQQEMSRKCLIISQGAAKRMLRDRARYFMKLHKYYEGFQQ